MSFRFMMISDLRTSTYVLLRSNIILLCPPVKRSFKDEDYLFLFIYLLLLLNASGYVPGGSDTTVHNTLLYNTQKHKITHTHSKQYVTQKLQTQCTQTYKHKVST